MSEWMAAHFMDIITALRYVTCIAMFMMLAAYNTGALHDRYEAVKRSLETGITGMMKKNKKKSMFSYEYCRERLDSMGVTYYSKGRITPFVYMVYKIGCVVAGIALMLVSGPMAVLFMAAAYILPDYMAKARNERDNKEMLGSLMDVYDVILLQVNSGEYITRILVDAYMVAKHPRLKSALVSLTGDIISTNDLPVSMELFGKKFDNENINNLVVLVKQLADTGVTSDMMRDIKNYLAVLQDSYNKYEQDKVERRCQACTYAVFGCLIGFILFACFKNMLDTFRLITA